MSKLSGSTKKEIAEIITSYCEGINHLEFQLKDLEQMVEEISNVYEIRRNAEYAGSRSCGNGEDMGE